MHSLFLCQLPPNLIRLFPRKVLFIKIAFSFPSLILCLIPPIDDREKTERRAKRYRALAAKNSALFLRLSPKKVDLIPKKVDSIPETVDLHFSPLHLTPYTRKKSTKMRFFLHISKKKRIFAPQLYNKLPYVTKNILENTIHQPLY